MEEERKQVAVEDVVRRLNAAHLKPYYDWLRQILGLSSGALTLLVALQGNYIPQHPEGLPLLQLCWGLLALSILSALVALYGESAIPLDAANALQKIRREKGEMAAALHIQNNNFAESKPIYGRARITTIYSFAFSVILMALFAIMNLSHSQQQEPLVSDHKTGG
jgi:hypothetical protein